MKLLLRKPNRLCEYVYSTNGAYLLTIRTQDRRKILSSIVGDDAHIASLFRKVGFLSKFSDRILS